jgi:hypothetical protein
VSVEIAMAIPIGVLLLLLVISAVRYSTALVDVQGAAADASRAASLTRTSAGAHVAGTESVAASLAGRCASSTTTVNTSAFRPGGTVTVEVTCTVTLRGMSRLALPGQVQLIATFTSPVDVYRHIPTAGQP